MQMQLTPTLSLMQSDILRSPHQTLTIPVNIRGVMGKGLALTTKQQFPAVYSHYRDLCQRKMLHLGQPAIYQHVESGKWFVLFPTKGHWRSKSRLEDIERGLRWLSEHFAAEGIESLAVPALGCGLGGLDWGDVGPVIARYLDQLQIPATIYLPVEQRPPTEQLTKQFLLGRA